MTASGQWTLGVLVGLPIALFFSFLMLVLIVLTVIYGVRNRTPGKRSTYKDGWDRYSDRRRAACFIGLPTFIMVAILIGAGFAMWPWKAEYHQFRQVSGTVSAVSSRLVAGDRSTNQKFVVILTSGPQQYGVDDTRAALLHPGDAVSLRCIRSYTYGSNDAGYDCKWGQS